METLVSVIVPIYNVEKYLNKCIDSIIKQTYSNLEVILVDDGSTDNSGRMCDEIASQDERIKVIHKTNGGLSDARNAGIDIARGDYYVFIDSDDYVAYDYVEILLNVCKVHNCEIAQCYCVETANDNCIFNVLDSDIKFYKSYDMIKRLYEDNSVETIVIWSKIYKRELFDNIRFPVGKIHEDEFTNYKLFDLCNKIAILPNSLYGYRVNPDSIVRSEYTLKRLDAFDAYDERIEYFKARQLFELVSLTNAAYVKLLILHLKELSKQKKLKTTQKQLSEKLKSMLFSVLKDKYVKFDFKIMLVRMLIF